jgi:hypothetical protein
MEELQDVFPGDVVDKMFPIAGGIPRKYFDKVTTIEEDILTALATVKVDEIMNPDLDKKWTHKLIQVIPNDDYTRYIIDFVSIFAFTAVRGALEQSSLARDKALLLQMHQRRFSNDAIGRMFESFALRVLETGEELCRFQLSPDRNVRSTLSRWELPKLRRAGFKYLSEVVPKKDKDKFVPMLYVPDNSCFPFVDALFFDGTTGNEVTLIQVTIAKMHHPKSKDVRDLFESLKNANLQVKAIVWVVTWPGGLSTWQSLEGASDPDFKKVQDDFVKVPQFVCPIVLSKSWVLEKAQIQTTPSVYVPFAKDDADLAKNISTYVTGGVPVVLDSIQGANDGESSSGPRLFCV